MDDLSKILTYNKNTITYLRLLTQPIRVNFIYIFGYFFTCYFANSNSKNVIILSQIENTSISSLRNYQKDSIKIEINIFISGKGWGYNIFINERLYIHQPYIPAVGGHKSFESDADALKVAKLVKEKIKNNIIPPTITINELDSLSIKR